MTPHSTRPPESLARRIASLRAQLGWTQEDLATRLAISRVAVSHIEIGMVVPSERTIVLLAGLFKQEPHELVAGTNYPVAKAERLPLVACRYTEVELQLALLQQDLGWIGRSGAHIQFSDIITHWQKRLDELSRRSYDASEQRQVEAAKERLRVMVDPDA